MSFFRQICNSATHQLINSATFLFKIHSCPNGLENIKFNHEMIALQAYTLESKLD